MPLISPAHHWTCVLGSGSPTMVRSWGPRCICSMADGPTVTLAINTTPYHLLWDPESYSELLLTSWAITKVQVYCVEQLLVALGKSELTFILAVKLNWCSIANSSLGAECPWEMFSFVWLLQFLGGARPGFFVVICVSDVAGGVAMVTWAHWAGQIFMIMSVHTTTPWWVLLFRGATSVMSSCSYCPG